MGAWGVRPAAESDRLAGVPDGGRALDMESMEADMEPYVFQKDEVDEYQAPGEFARYARFIIDPDAIEGAQLSIGVFRYEPGQIGPGHTHAEEAEVYYVLKGQASVELDGRVVELREGTALYVPPGVLHETKNTGDGELEFLGIFGPAMGFGKIKADWTRVGQ